MAYDKAESRQKRKLRIRKKISGTAERPRLSVFRSTKHIYAQLVDDAAGTTLLQMSTLSGDVKGEALEATKSGAVRAVGKAVAAACKARGVDKVVFDRNGFLYHGRIKALADAAREAGLAF